MRRNRSERHVHRILVVPIYASRDGPKVKYDMLAETSSGEAISVNRDRARSRFLLLAFAAAILLLGAIRHGDLTGYDDALYSTEAKNIAQSGDWLTPKTRGMPALEHPPLFVWTQAAFLKTFGVSDMVAKLPTALSAVAVVLLVYWLALRLLKDTLAASVAMFAMLATPYFIKYADHAMTDIPTTLLFVCAISAWMLADSDGMDGTGSNPRWYLAAGAFTAMALMVRGLIGLGLPLIFALHLIAARRRPRWSYLLVGLGIAFAPLVIWYVYLWLRHGDYFIGMHEGWLSREVYGSLSPAWRRYTGVPEYAWMLLKSDWPWLPATLGGIVIVSRERRPSLLVLLAWAGTVFLLCAAAKSRVLRYMLPAYPAFAILAAIAIMKWTPRRLVERAMQWAPPAALLAAIGIVFWMPPIWHAKETRAIAQAESRNLPVGAPFDFYDKGDPRYDETNELEWYGTNIPVILLTRQELDEALQDRSVRVIITDEATYRERIRPLPHEVIARSGHLISARLIR
jgi:4-amino-4-deoxy-L-arabinose transferase-like glycosyltransferase